MTDDLQLHLRVMAGEIRALGPGKADLLELIERTGSISQAAREMDMSYRRAWGLVRQMNEAFESPLVETAAGGAQGGGAGLTALGRRLLAMYRAAEAAARAAAQPHVRAIRRHLRD